MNNKKLVKFIFTLAISFTFLPFMVSCKDSFIFDDEGDCAMKVKFEFVRHRQALNSITGTGNDAFSNEVESVHLFIFDSETKALVYDKIEKTADLIDGNIMSVTLQPGKYDFIAWCGLDSNDENNAFELQHKYSTRASEDKLALKMHEENVPVHNAKFDDVYHGVTKNFKIDESNLGGMVPVSVIKDTNHINVWIQHPHASLANGDFEVFYEDDNGMIHFETNEIIPNSKYSYKSFKNEILQTSTEYNGEQLESGAMISHLSVSRLMEKNRQDARLVVKDKTGKEVFSVPFIKFVLGLQTFTEEGTQKDDQWYMDCEDTFNCSFFFTSDDGTWAPVRIIVNNWVKVPDQEWEF